MAEKVAFRNERSGEVKHVKVGWSWTCFLFGATFGLPFFFRKAFGIGLLIAGCQVAWIVGSVMLETATPDLYTDRLDKPILLAVSILLGRFGNKFTAQYYLKYSWTFVDPNAEESILAREKWALA